MLKVPPPQPPGPVTIHHPPPGGGTTMALAITEVVQELLQPLFITVKIYEVVVFDGGITIIDPDVPRRIFPGLRVPVRAFAIVHESVAPLPLSILFGLIAMVQDGIGIGGTITGAAVTEATQELVPAELVTVRVYGVVAFDGGMMATEPDVPRRIFPGLRVPVRAFAIVHESVAPLPLSILFGLIVMVQDGGDITMLAIDNKAKYEK